MRRLADLEPIGPEGDVYLQPRSVQPVEDSDAMQIQFDRDGAGNSPRESNTAAVGSAIAAMAERVTELEQRAPRGNIQDIIREVTGEQIERVLAARASRKRVRRVTKHSSDGRILEMEEIEA